MTTHEYFSFLIFIDIRSTGVLAVKYIHVYAYCIHTYHVPCFSTLVTIFPFHIETKCPRALTEHQSLKGIECC